MLPHSATLLLSAGFETQGRTKKQSSKVHCEVKKKKKGLVYQLSKESGIQKGKISAHKRPLLDGLQGLFSFQKCTTRSNPATMELFLSAFCSLMKGETLNVSKI